MIDYSIKIGGEAGQGLQSLGSILARAFCLSGYHIFAVQDYESRIRGGHASFYLRFSTNQVEAPRETITCLVAFDQQTLNFYRDKVSPDGFILYNSDSIKEPISNNKYIPIPLEKIAIETGGEKIFANSVAIGVIIGLIGCEFDILKNIFADFFSGKNKDNVIDNNIKSAKAGFDSIHKIFPTCPFPIELKAPAKRMIITGNEAIALGALAAGCKFYSGYPMTPSTGILNYMAHASKEMGVIVEQAEDEIGAINMALGASYAGVRAMTASAGGGFALMVEGLSLAAMTETPIVIGLAQRPAPATGLPTRTEQADLEFILHAGHGEFPRAIFTPGTAEQCFYLTAQAFQIADKYQIPVFVMTDQHLADSYQDFAMFDVSKVETKQYVMTDEELSKLTEYKRYQLTSSGISPRALPGQSKHLVIADSDEHTEDGHLTEDLKVRIEMVNKRLRKYEELRKEIIAPTIEGNGNAKTLLICWGSNYGLVKEAANILNQEKGDVAMMHFQQLWPFPKDDFLRQIKGIKKLIVIENNATGQLTRLIKSETCISNMLQINKYNGLPFTVDEILKEIESGE